MDEQKALDKLYETLINARQMETTLILKKIDYLLEIQRRRTLLNSD